MGKTKLKRFSEINSFSNVVQPECQYPASDYHLRGMWHKAFFHNNQPIILEIGCGKGEYTLALAKAYPHLNFLGVDIKGDRLWVGARKALHEGLYNVGFIRVQAEHLRHFFQPGEVGGIWITFPDPQPNKPKAHKRLTSPKFLGIYKDIVAPEALLHLKTDSRELYDFSLEVIPENGYQLLLHSADLYQERPPIDPLVYQIQTYYENIYLQRGKPICFIQFSLKK